MDSVEQRDLRGGEANMTEKADLTRPEMDGNQRKEEQTGDGADHRTADLEASASAPPAAGLGIQGDDGPLKAPSFLDRFLVVWIFLAMVVGILLGQFVPSTSKVLERNTFGAIGLLVMMYPILCKVRYETLHLLLWSRALWKQVLLSLVLNWLVGPLVMTGLAWAFLPDRAGLREGLIFVGAGRCIAMVLIWNELAGGDGDYCAVLVAFNSMLQTVAFAPVALFYIKVVSRADADLALDYRDVASSVAVFLGIPLAAAVFTRFGLVALVGARRYQAHFIRLVAPLSLVGLIFTIVVLFALQGAQVVAKITSVLRVAAPLLLYFALIFPLALAICRRCGFGYRLSCTQSFTAASNNFELAIAVTVAVYGPGSEQALASTVGPLIEVPVLVGLVYSMRWCRTRWRWE
ncbi:MAG: hypothetical protein M1832_004651 [Thelocarpon impressellum]|nr:MAG: hypothetical protein M1832_004651 [Thelocarpon impressellum]